MNWQQKVWKGAGVIFYACRPLLLYLATPGLAMMAGKLIRRYRYSNQEFIAESGNFYTFISLLIVWGVMTRVCKKRGTTICEEATLNFREQNRKLAVLYAGFGFSISLFLSALLSLIPFRFLTQGYSEAAGAIYQKPDLILVLLTTGFMAPVLEEILFRGYLLNRLLTWFDERYAVYICAAVFALCHVNPIWMLYAFAMGVFLARIAIQKDNIFYAVCVHIGFNLPSVLIACIQTAGLGESLFFRSWILIFLYGAAAVLTGRLIWFGMKEEEEKEWQS
jgi:membrane protease YdiL (CAAX protease family)